jgi:hypothetical protein
MGASFSPRRLPSGRADRFDRHCFAGTWGTHGAKAGLDKAGLDKAELDEAQRDTAQLDKRLQLSFPPTASVVLLAAR